MGEIVTEKDGHAFVQGINLTHLFVLFQYLGFIGFDAIHT